MLAERLQTIHELFGQIPDTFINVWVKVALNDEAEIAELTDKSTATRNLFVKNISKIEDASLKKCALVLSPISVRELKETWWGSMRPIIHLSTPWLTRASKMDKVRHDPRAHAIQATQPLPNKT